jgi:hypothetical protein
MSSFQQSPHVQFNQPQRPMYTSNNDRERQYRQDNGYSRDPQQRVVEEDYENENQYCCFARTFCCCLITEDKK